MAINRVFLGWNKPCLPTVVDWLENQLQPTEGRTASGRPWDLSNFVVVTPGRRAGRRLLELLVERAEPRGLLSPRLVTVGQLPELLYTPDRPVVGEWESKLFRVACLRRAAPHVLESLLREIPDTEQWGRWLAVADHWATVVEDLAAYGITLEAARNRLVEELDFCDLQGWDALVRLQHDYENELKIQGRTDVHLARAEALAKGCCATASQIVLVSVVEMGRLLKELLIQTSAEITALVFGLEEAKEDFDDLGALHAGRWAGRIIPIKPDIIRVVDQPSDQAAEVLRVLEANSAYAADQITVGLGDAGLGPMIQRALEGAGAPARIGAGRVIAKTRPAVFLSAAGRYLDSNRFDDLATLLRHPDLEKYLLGSRSEDAIATDGAVSEVDDASTDSVHGGIEHWLTLLDRYLTEHCQAKPTRQWLGHPDQAAALKLVHDHVHELLSARRDDRQPLSHWMGWITALLEKAYGANDVGDPGNEDVAVACESIFELMAELAGLSAGPEQPVRPHEAIEILSHALSKITIPDPDHRLAVELLGWLELPLDDADLLVVTGFNEGSVPRATKVEMFLPQRARRVLGLPHDLDRDAHDAWALTAILNSGRQVTLIAGRRDADGQPLTPSRLLLTGDAEAQARIILRFYGRDLNKRGDPSPAETNDNSPEPHPRPHAANPSPSGPPNNRTPFNNSSVLWPVRPITRLPVTAFQDYLRCPTRFFFKHVLKLKTLEESKGELAKSVFGTLAHDVFHQFGKSPESFSTDAQQVEHCLHHCLDRAVVERIGGSVTAAVEVQIHRLRQRLGALAHQQADRAAEGWRIVPEFVEASLTATLTVDGQPFEITGKIDRVDHHPDLGWCIWDYKTGDSGLTPEKAHHKGRGENRAWANLQLPLYRTLAAPKGVDGDVGVGFVLLPKTVQSARFVAAGWRDEDFNSALACAQVIIRKIRAGLFWPPGESPQWNDGLKWLCLDRCPPRLREQALRHIVNGRFEHGFFSNPDDGPPLGTDKKGAS